MLSSYHKIFFVIGITCLFFHGCSGVKIPAEKQLEIWWKSYKKHFLLPDGRIQRPEHACDTVSEGQAYAMISSVFINDKKTFDLIFHWTEDHLSRGKKYGDHLLAWHWKNGDVDDWMPASDADCDYAFALLLASRQWNDQGYREKAMQIINDIMGHETVRGGDNRLFLLPGLWGNETNGYLIQNPSYYNPAAFRRFYETTRDNHWLHLVETSYWLFSQAGVRLDTVNGCGLIPDWCMVDVHGNILKVEDRSADYGWESVRIPVRIGLDILWYKTEEGNRIIAKMYQFLQSSFSRTGEIKAAYYYTGEPSVAYGGLASDAILYFMAQILVDKSDAIKISFKKRLNEKVFLQNYYGQSMAFYPLALERGILKKL